MFFCDPIPPEMLVKHVKLLGVTISNDLKWDTRVSNIVKQANVSLSIFRLLKKFNCSKIHSLLILELCRIISVLKIFEETNFQPRGATPPPPLSYSKLHPCSSHFLKPNFSANTWTSRSLSWHTRVGMDCKSRQEYHPLSRKRQVELPNTVRPASIRRNEGIIWCNIGRLFTAISSIIRNGYV